MDFSSTVLSCLGDLSIRSAGLAVLAAAMLWLLRARSASTRHNVWTLVAVSMLALPLLTPLLPALEVPVLRPVESLVAIPMQDLPALEAADPPSGPAEATSTIGKLSWQQALLAIYFLGVLLLLGRLGFGYLLTGRLMRASARVELESPDASFGRIYESSWISVPMTAGWLRPAILLPVQWREWENPKLQAVLVHELTHVRRNDWAIAVLAVVNRCVFWFHPLAWWLEWRLASLAEQACDDAALLTLGNREQYARALLEMAAAVRWGQGRLAWEAMAMANPAEVKTRIERILDDARQIPRGLTRGRRVVLALACVPLLCLVSALQPAPAQAPPQTRDIPLTGTGPYLDSLVEGHRLTAGDADRLERNLDTNPADLAIRGRLIAHYFLNAQREPRLRHIFWLIEHHPESEITGFTSAGISPQSTVLNDRGDYELAKQLWLRQAQRHEGNTRLLANASRFFSTGGDFEEAERLLKRAQSLEPQQPVWKERLAILYVQTIAQAHRIGSESPFAARVKAELEVSTDARLITMVGNQLNSIVRFSRETRAPVPGFANLGERLMQWGQQLLGMQPTVRPPQQAVPLAESASMPSSTAPAPIHSVPAPYPPLAEQARIQGSVRLALVAGQDGRVSRIQLLSGHPLLISAAIAAVQQWVYEPTYENGQPVEVTTQAMVPFTLPPAGSATPQAIQPLTEPKPIRIRVGGNVQASKLVSKVEPQYPALAKQAGVEGIVRFMVTVAPDGRVRELQLLDGHPLVTPAAQEAVKEWVYEETRLGGQPVEVITQVYIPFALPDR